ncbi:hypothetical protein Dimus_001499, partial [Dionaea muscipula]
MAPYCRCSRYAASSAANAIIHGKSAANAAITACPVSLRYACSLLTLLLNAAAALAEAA